jgi:hypothetical protein
MLHHKGGGRICNALQIRRCMGRNAYLPVGITIIEIGIIGDTIDHCVESLPAKDIDHYQKVIQVR